MRSLITERNNLCREGANSDSRKYAQEFEEIKHLIETKISPLSRKEDTHSKILQKYLQ